MYAHNVKYFTAKQVENLLVVFVHGAKIITTILDKFTIGKKISFTHFFPGKFD